MLRSLAAWRLEANRRVDRPLTEEERADRRLEIGLSGLSLETLGNSTDVFLNQVKPPGTRRVKDLETHYEAIEVVQQPTEGREGMPDRHALATLGK